MFFGQSPQEIRQVFITAFEHYSNRLPLTPLDQQLIAVILEHPEYHDLLRSGEKALQRDYLPELGETNPFLHMGLHLAIREQISTNRPEGIQSIFHLLKNKQSEHDIEHTFMDHLAHCLWEAQKENRMPDETSYLHKLLNLKGHYAN